MKYNYQIKIEYLGTNFVGWQIQKNGKSVQEIIQKALTKTFKTKIKIIGSGRTDAGVHAKEQSANFNLNTEIKNKFLTLSSINFFLKKYSITILDIKKRNINFHSRFSAKKRLYEYIIINRPTKLSIDNKKAWLVKKKLNIQEMKKGIKLLIGTHDFSTFRASSCSAQSPIRTINKANVLKIGNKIILKFESKSFLQQQVRSMVGCLKYLGENKWELKKFIKNFKDAKREKCAPPAPPHGLYLKKITY